MTRKYSYAYKVRIQRETLPKLQELARKLKFTVDTPGSHFGEPSPGAMLDALAAAYDRDPSGVALALRVIGVTNRPNDPPPIQLFPKE